MASGLACIQEELRRLQQAGVDHVFVDEATLALLKPVPTAPPASAATPTPTGSGTKGEGFDLLAATRVASPATPAADTPASAKKHTPPAAVPFPEPPTLELPEGTPTEQMQWLRERVQQCKVCADNLYEGDQLVFGSGAIGADIFFCGDAPGADEAATGEPFCGEAGDLLTKIIKAMNLSREEVYLTNLLKWRPHRGRPFGNAMPTAEAIRFCLPYLRAQVSIVRPKVIVGLGNHTLSGLLGPDSELKMGSVRGCWHTFDGIPLMITFHPAYLQLNGTTQTKRTAWEDLLQVMEKAGLPISEKQRGYFLSKS